MIFGKKIIQYAGYKEFHDIKESSTWCEYNYQNLKNFTKYIINTSGVYEENKQYDSLKHYCGYTHKEINFYLKKCSDLGQFSQRKSSYFHTLAADVEELLRIYKTPEDIILYKSIENKDYLYDMFIKGNPKKLKGNFYIQKSFMSTTFLFSVLEENFCTKVYMKIRCPKGTYGIPVFMCPGIGRDFEQEFLLPPNRAFFVSDIIKDRKKNTVIECDIIDASKYLWEEFMGRTETKVRKSNA